jgi:hypothetical protein
MSSSGQYILIGGNAGTVNSAALSYFSSNYGANWLSAVGTPTQSYGISVAMSSNGQYMLNVGYGNAGVYISSAIQSSGIPIQNFATTFVSNPGGLPSNFAYPGTGMSASGQYLIVSEGGNGNGTWLSSNYGVSFTQLPKTGATLGFANGTGANPNNYNTNNISGNGQYMILVCNGNTAYLSSNYGNYWSLVSGIANFAYVAISFTGQYLIAGNVNVPYISSNYGNNWTIVSSLSSINFQVASMSSTGQYMMLTQNSTTPCSIYTSSSFGAYWVIAQSLPNNAQTYFGTVNYTGQYMGVGDTTGGAIYISSTYGANFAKITGYTRVWDFAISMTGQYMVFGADDTGINGLWASSAYGISSSWYKTPYNTSSSGVQTVKMSLDGTRLFVGPRSASGGYALCSSGIVPTNTLSTFGPNISFSSGLSVSVQPNLWYRFETADVNGTNLLNYASGLYDATLVNGANITTTAGQYRVGSGALKLTGASSQSVNLNSSFTLSANGFSIAFWGYYISGSTTSRFFDFSTKMNGESGTKISFYCMINGGIDIRFDGGTQSIQFTAPASQNTWKHYVCTYSSSGDAKFYVDGVLTTSSSSIYQGALTIPYFFIGKSTWAGDPYMTSYTDDFQFYNGYILTPSEVTNIYNNTLKTSLSSPTVSTSVYKTSYGTTWVTNPGTGLSTFYGNGWVSMSGSGQYILAADSPISGGNGAFLSSNFGNNWTLLGTANGFSGVVKSCSYTTTVSNSGQYMIFGGLGELAISTNYGRYFKLGPSVGSLFVCTATSSDGKYMMYMACNSTGPFVGSVNLSTDTGTTWTTTGYSGFDVKISGTGQYMFISNNSGVYVSNNFGLSFVLRTATNAGLFGAISYTGEYMYAWGYLSSNYGVSFQSISKTNGAAISYTGQFILIGNDFSSDYGASYTTLSGLTQTRGITMSNYAEYMAGFNNSLQLSSSVSSSISTTAVVPNPYWHSVTTDATGQYVNIGSIMNQGIWYSSDFATTWQNSNQIVGTIQQLANSGTYMLAAINNLAGVYYSSNYGIWWQTATMPNTNNFASVSMSSSSTYAVAGSIGGGVVYSSTFGQTWTSSNLTTATYLEVAMSSTGQYALASNSTTIYYSTNFGQTFIASSLTSANAQSLAVSQTGQYAIAGTTTGIYYSMNYGQNWTQSNQIVGTWYGINMMSSGQYVVAGNAGQGLWYSLNFGQTWTQSTTNKTDTWYQISTTPSGSYLYAVSQSDTIYQETNVTGSMVIPLNGLPTVTSNWQTVAMDSTGQYQLLGVNSGFLYYTNNFGNAWSTISGQSPMTGSYNSGNGLPTVALAWNTTIINSTGQYALAGINNGSLYMSTNFATNWVPISGLGPLGATGPWLASNYGFTTNSLAWQTTAINSSGQYMLAGSNNNFLFLSTNSGTYWAIIGGSAYGSTFGQGLPTTNGAWYTSAISSTGQYMATGLYGGAFYFSNNYGQAWTAYTNSPLTSTMNWKSMSMTGNGSAIVASVNGSNIYNMTTMVIPTATYTPPQISGTSSTDGTGLKYIIKL